MKIRTNFVSNSSSSSFILAANFASEEELHRYLFGENEVLLDEEFKITSKTVSARIFNDFSSGESATLKELIYAFSGRYYYAVIEYFSIGDTGIETQSGFVYQDSPCFGTDTFLLNKIKELSILEKEKYNSFYRGIDEADKDNISKDLYKIWTEKRKLTLKLAAKDAKAFVEKFKGKTIKILEYGDNHGPCYGALGAVIENGKFWDKLDHVCISNH